MLDLSPTKLIIIFVVAIVLLGPKRLPQVARQLGAAWAKLRTYSQRIDSELRQSMPDLPTSRDIARYARSPITLLNELADGSSGGAGALAGDPAAPTGPSSHATGGDSGGDSGDDSGDGATGDAWPRDPGSGDPSRNPADAALQGARAEEHADPPEPRAHADLAVLAVDDPMLN